MREYSVKARTKGPERRNNKGTLIMLERQDIIEILCGLLLGQEIYIDPSRRFTRCLGLIKSRTLLTASLLRPCDCPYAVGRFVLLDIDAGGIPRDDEGVVRPGESVLGLTDVWGGPQDPLVGEEDDTTMSEDLTQHIEADWAGNRDCLLLTFRYKGRRLISLNPAKTDLYLCWSCVDPVPTTLTMTSNVISTAVPSGISDLLSSKRRVGASGEHPVLFQAYNHPNLRYAAVGVYQSNGLRLASNCVQTAYESTPKVSGCVVVAAEGPCGQTIREEAAKEFLPGRV